jgi:sugar phosphate permease
LRETFSLWTPTYFAQTTGTSAGEAASKSGLFPLSGGASVILCGWLSDRLGRRGRAALMLGSLVLSGVVLLGSGIGHGSRTWPVILVGTVAILILGPYSFLAGDVALDFGGKQGSGTASGLIGHHFRRLSVASISANYGWGGAFLVLAGIAFLSGTADIWFLCEERRIGIDS